MRTIAYLFGLLVFSCLYSCSSKGLPSEFKIGTDHVVIAFYDAKHKPFTVLDTEDANQISQAIKVISRSNAPSFKCGYSGSITYYNAESSLEAEFNLSEDCNHIVFMNGDNLVAKKLTKEGRAFLLSFMEKSLTKQTVQVESPIIAFHFYGELLPTNLVIQDSISTPYGFRMERLTGCEIDAEKKIAIQNHNKNADGQMTLIYGENWRENFEKETNFSLSPYGIPD